MKGNQGKIPIKVFLVRPSKKWDPLIKDYLLSPPASGHFSNSLSNLQKIG
jgi:hypothetical protein